MYYNFTKQNCTLAYDLFSTEETLLQDFFSHSEANASELLENIEDKFLR